MDQVKAQASRNRAGSIEQDAKAEGGGNAAPPAWAQDPGGEEAAGSNPAAEPSSASGSVPAEAQSREARQEEQAESAPRPESQAPQPK